MANSSATAAAYPDRAFDQDGELITAGTGSAYTVKTARRILGNYRGLRICAQMHTANTGACTLQVDDAPAASIKTPAGGNPATGELVDGEFYDFIYDPDLAAWQFQGYAPALSVGAGIENIGNVLSSTLGRTFISDITSGLTLTEAHRARNIYIDAASGSGTITLSDNTVIRTGFWTIIRNGSAGEVTLQAAAGEEIDVVSSWILYPGGTILLQKASATAWRSTLLTPMRATYNSSGTFVKPGTLVGTYVQLEAWGAGGAGGKGSTDIAGGGGGGGGYSRMIRELSELTASNSVTVGSGGAAQTTASTAGATGGNSEVMSAFVMVRAFGGAGGGGVATGAGGGGGGSNTTGNGRFGGEPNGNTTAGQANQGFGGGNGGVSGGTGGNSAYGGGGGGGGDAATGGVGGFSFQGAAGGGGGGDTTAGGGGATSWRGGSGGAGATGSANASAGGAPGGGGGGSETGNSGAGGNGRVIITVF